MEELLKVREKEITFFAERVSLIAREEKIKKKKRKIKARKLSTFKNYLPTEMGLRMN